MEITELLEELFVNRTDFYAEAYVGTDKKRMSYAKKKNLGSEKIIQHIKGKKTIGLYQLNKNNKVKWACLDFDLNTKEDFENAKNLFKRLKEEKHNPLMEMSGGGEYKCHIWLFCDCKAKDVLLYLQDLCERTKIKPHEIFPKQIEVTESSPYGNLVKLPLGFHLISKERSYLLDKDYTPLVELDSIRDLLQFHLDNLSTIPKKIVKEEKLTDYTPQAINSSEFDKFFNFVLNNELPSGQSAEKKIYEKITGINDNILKNLAIWFYQKGYTLKQLEKEVKPLYQEKGWAFGDLKGWFKKASQDKEKFKQINPGEIAEYLIQAKRRDLIELLPTEQKKETNEKLQVLSLSQLNTLDIKPVEWLVKDLIPKKSIVILAGKRGTFKSFGAIDLTLCIASGKPFFNVFETKVGRILYVDEENGVSILKERTDKLKTGLELQENKDINERIFYTSRQNIKLDSVKWKDKIINAIIEYKPDLIIIDSLRRVISFDENVAGEISALFTDIITPLTEKYNLTWVLLHHLRKGMSGKYISDEMDELRGSSDLPNFADIVIIFDRKKGEADKFIMKQVKCRYASEIPAKLIQLTWNENNLKMECIGDAQDTLQADKMVAEMTMKWLAEEQKTSFKTKEILGVMESQKQSRASVYRALDILQEGDKPKIRKIRRGEYELNTYVDLSQYSK